MKILNYKMERNISEICIFHLMKNLKFFQQEGLFG